MIRDELAGNERGTHSAYLMNDAGRETQVATAVQLMTMMIYSPVYSPRVGKLTARETQGKGEVRLLVSAQVSPPLIRRSAQPPVSVFRGGKWSARNAQYYEYSSRFVRAAPH